MDTKIHWKLPNAPIWINVAGARGAGKRRVASELYRRCVERMRNGWDVGSVAVFIPGNVVRFIAQMVDLDQEQKVQLGQAIELFEKYRRRIELGDEESLTSVLQTCAEWSLSDRPQVEGLINQRKCAEIERLINLFEYEPEVRQNLRQILRKIRHFLSNTINAQIIISGNPGHFPTATLNFFLLRPRESRIKALNEINGAGDVVTQQDLSEESRVKRDYEVFQSRFERESDPSARLIRYPGHFIPVSILEGEIEDALDTMERHLRAVVSVQMEMKSQRRKLATLLEQDRLQAPQGRFSILLLKGGGFDKFYGSVNGAILRRLTERRHFDIFLGCKRRVSLDHALIRWNFLEERMLDLKHKLHPRGARPNNEMSGGKFVEILDEVIYLMQIHDHWRLNRRLEELNKDRSNFPLEIREIISRALTFLKYVTTTSQYMLLKRCSAREDIVIDWGLGKGELMDGVRRVQKKKYFDVDALPPIREMDGSELLKNKKILREFLSHFDEQEFVKLILIGAAGEDLDQGKSLRSMVWSVLKSKPHGWFDDLIEADLSIDDFASIVNGIHGPNGPRGDDMELQKEILLLPAEDVVTFNSLLELELA